MSMNQRNARPVYSNPTTDKQREVNRWSSIAAEKLGDAYTYNISNDDPRWVSFYLHAYQALASLAVELSETADIIKIINDTQPASSGTRANGYTGQYTPTMQMLREGKLTPGGRYRKELPRSVCTPERQNALPMYANPVSDEQRRVNQWAENAAEKIPNAVISNINNDDHRWEEIYLHAYQALSSLPEDHIETVAIIDFINKASVSSSGRLPSPFNEKYTVTMQLLKDDKLVPGTALYLSDTPNRVKDGEQAKRHLDIKGPMVYEKTLQPNMLPVFGEDLPLRDPMIVAKMNMVRKAFKMAHRRMHNITQEIVPVTPQSVRLVCEFGLYGYLALAKMRPDEPEASDIITMLHNLYRELTGDGKYEYRLTPTMYLLRQEDDKFMGESVLLRQGDTVISPSEKSAGNVGDVFLTCSTELPNTVKQVLQEVLDCWAGSGNVTVLDHDSRNLVKRPVSVEVTYVEPCTFKANFTTIGETLHPLAMRFIIANLKAADSDKSTFTVDGTNALYIRLADEKACQYEDVRELIRVAIQNNIIHSLLTVAKDRYTNEITFKSRK